MTREEWAERIIKNYASGFGLWPQIQEARDYLAGKEPPLVDKWEPTAKKAFEDKKNQP